MRCLLTCLLLFLPSIATAAPTVLVVGDSISAGHGVAVDAGWVARLRARMNAEGYPQEVVNASISGDTTSGGLTRLPALLRQHSPAIVIIELGGNDGLRGLSLDAMRKNLTAMIRRSRAAGARVLLLGIRLPPNYGSVYIDRFTGVYRQAAHDTGVALVPKILAGVGERRDLMQEDGIHPNAQGHARVLENVWPTLKPMLDARVSTDG